jgi:hypothetical protein
MLISKNELIIVILMVLIVIFSWLYTPLIIPAGSPSSTVELPINTILFKNIIRTILILLSITTIIYFVAIFFVQKKWPTTGRIPIIIAAVGYFPIYLFIISKRAESFSCFYWNEFFTWSFAYFVIIYSLLKYLIPIVINKFKKNNNIQN